MKATEQYFPVMLFIMLYKVALTFQSVDQILIKGDRSNESYTEKCVFVVPFIMLYDVVITFESIDQILKCMCPFK